MSVETESEDIFNDRNHWRIGLRGPVNGVVETRCYHLGAETQVLARRVALETWSDEFDEMPFISQVERYATWRLWENWPFGRTGI